LELRLEGCAIRSCRSGDAASIARFANDRRIWRNLRDRFPFPYTRDDAVAWIRHASEMRPETHFAIDVGGLAVGAIGFELQPDVYRRSAEVGYWLGHAYWGRGITTQALRALTDYAFSSFDICRLYAGVFAWNPASARVLEKAGYTLEGRLRQRVTKDGESLDELLYAIVR
jgi:RimJ/RimL family protein N-acetyltransferase